MTFDLRISFTGLCLFVPEDAADVTQRRMHALMPASYGHAHFPRLLYDRAFETQNSTDYARELRCIDLERQQLSLAPNTVGAALALPEEAIPLDAGGPMKGVDRTLIGATPPDVVVSRVTLGDGGVSDYTLGLIYRFGAATPRPMAQRLEWTIRGISGNVLRLPDLVSLDDGTTKALAPLYPIGETIHLHVYHVIGTELPRFNWPLPIPDPLNADVRDHFPLYYYLCPPNGASPGSPVLEMNGAGDPLPTLKGGCPDLSRHEKSSDAPHDHKPRALAVTGTATAGTGDSRRDDPQGGITAMCMVASARLR